MQLYNEELEVQIVRTVCDAEWGDYLLGKLTDKHFHSDAGRIAFGRVSSLLRAGKDRPSFTQLCMDPIIPQEHRETLDEHSDLKPLKKSQVDTSLDLVGNYATLRDMLMVSEGIIGSLTADGADVKKVVKDTVDRLTNIALGTTEAKTLDLARDKEALDLAKSIINGDGTKSIPTGFSTWDDVNTGFPVTSTTLIGASTGGGKSLWGVAFAKNLSEMGYRPLIIPLEMSPRELHARIMANIAEIPVNKVLAGRPREAKESRSLSDNINKKSYLTQNEADKLRDTYIEWRKNVKKIGGSYLIHEISSPTMTEALYSAKSHNPDIIIIDYIALLAGMDGDNDWRNLSEAVREAKRFSMKHEIPTVILAQLGNDGDLRYSKRMKDDADVAWFWTTPQKEKGQTKSYVEVQQHKARNLNPFPFPLAIEWPYMRMRDLTVEERMEYEQQKRDSYNEDDKKGGRRSFKPTVHTNTPKEDDDIIPDPTVQVANTPKARLRARGSVQ